jgi:hypothetical protein
MTAIDLTSSIVYANNINAGLNTASASASWDGDSNHTGDDDSKSFSIARASSTVTVTCSTTPTYTGSALTPCTAEATGVNLTPVNLTSAIVYANNKDAGVNTASATATWAGDSNHTGDDDSKNFSIAKATSTVTVTCPTTALIYTGSALTPCSATASGAGITTPIGLTVDYPDDHTNVGTATANASWAGDSNHTGNSGSNTFGIAQATPVVNVTFTGGTFTAAAFNATGSVTGAGGANLGTPAFAYYSGTTAAGSPLAGAPVDAGTYTVRGSYPGSLNYTSAYKDVTMTIAPAGVTLTVSATNVQYSDSTTITYSVSTVPPGLTGTLQFRIGTRLLTPTVPVSGGASGTYTAIVTELPGSYPVTAIFTSSSGNFLSANLTATNQLLVNQENATVKYTGTTYAWVNSNDQAPISLTAMVYDDPDKYPGDVTNARVSFINRDNGAPMGTCKDVRVDLVDPSNRTYGTATCNWVGNLQKTDNAETFTVGVVVSYAYGRDVTGDDTFITLARNAQSQILTLGTSISEGAAPVSNRGAVSGGASFAFDVTYNKSLTNLQGSASLTFSAGGRYYRVKSNSLVSLVRQVSNASGDGTATLTSKASITDVTNPSSPVAVEGNATIAFDVTSSGAGAPGDKVAITVSGKDGGVVYSNYFIPATGRTSQQSISAGDIVIK